MHNGRSKMQKQKKNLSVDMINIFQYLLTQNPTNQGTPLS